jgi:Tfp pilus assembly PilM family ATPase/Tfp pilus assembly protein PilN
MSKRVGIEIGPSHCRIVEVETSGGGWPRRSVVATPSRVRTFASIPYGTSNPVGLAAALRPLLARRAFPRRAAVAVWGLRSSHQYLLLPPADAADLIDLGRREARRTAPTTVVDANPSDGVLVGNVRDVPGAGGQREVTYVSSSAADVRNKIQPLVDAGVQVDAVVTPAVALAWVARLRTATPDAVVAYVAVESDVTCLSVVRNGVILFGREIGWGYAGERQFDRDQFAAKLAAELRRSFAYVKQSFRADVRHIVVAGGFPEPRALTAPLMEAVGVDVEVLDSLEGVDVTALPEPADEFRGKVAELRMAWALAAEASAVNLLPREIRSKAANRQEQIRLAAGAAAGLLVAAVILLVVTLLAAAAERHAQSLRQQIATLEPQMRQLEQQRQRQLVTAARRAALDAFATQGPRLARVLEVLDRSTPGDVVIKTLQVKPQGASWRLVLGGESVADNAAQAQGSFNQFLRAAQTSPLLGLPVQPPVITVNSGEPGVEAVEARERATSSASEGVTDVHGPATAAGMPGPDYDAAYETYRRQLAENQLAVEQRRRRPFEEHWNRHPVKPLEYYQWLEEERAYNRSIGRREPVGGAAAPGAKPAAPLKPKAVLAFLVEFEVRK